MIRSVVIFLLFVTHAHSAGDYVVELMQVSKSGKTLFLNKGSANKLAQGEYGVLIKKTILSDKKFIFKPVAKLKLLKLFTHKSIWVAYEVFIPKLLQANERLILFSESELLAGRRKLDIKRTTLVTNKDVTTEVRDFMLEGDNLAKKDGGYIVVSETHKAQKHYDKDVELVDIEKWENKLGDEKVFGTAIYKSPYAADFSQRRRVQSFEKMAVAFLNKYNDPNFSREKIYGKQVRDQFGYLSSDPVRENADQLSDDEVEKKRLADEKLLKSLKAGGEGWSKAYTNEQLKNVLGKLSIAKEKERRKGIISQKFSFQTFFGAGLNLVNNENINDAETTEQSRIDFEVGIEGYLLDRLRDFEKVTFEFSFRRANDAFFGGDLNVESIETSIAAHLNWYPFFNPNVIGQHIVYFGILYRYGFATLANNTSDESGNYRLSSFPGLRASVKYNFENSFGYRVHFGFENISVDKIDTDVTSGNLPARAGYIDAKINLSISRFF